VEPPRAVRLTHCGVRAGVSRSEIDPSFVITHRMPLNDAPLGFDTFLNKEDGCLKVVMNP
jgi:threonine dehydrogenase-like Zn-dependent dehydrogenase